MPISPSGGSSRQGCTYAIAGADYRGYAHLKRGASGMESANYYYLSVNTELRVNRGWSSRKAISLLTVDSTDGRIGTVYHVAWKKC